MDLPTASTSSELSKFVYMRDEFDLKIKSLNIRLKCADFFFHFILVSGKSNSFLDTVNSFDDGILKSYLIPSIFIFATIQQPTTMSYLKCMPPIDENEKNR